MKKKKLNTDKLIILIGIVLISLLFIVLPPLLRFMDSNKINNNLGTIIIDDEENQDKEDVNDEVEDNIPSTDKPEENIPTDDGTGNTTKYPSVYVDPYGNGKDNSPKYTSGKLTCTSLENGANRYVVYYENGKLTKYDVTKITTYNEVKEKEEEFSDYMNNCSNTSKDYKNISGYSRSCTQDGGTLTEEIKYDLSKFSKKTITLSSGKNEEVISIFSYRQNIEDVINKLTEDKHMCN